eukprot:SAG11_NODE_1138_length_5724_cov_188.276978_4_plen_123_part_00
MPPPSPDQPPRNGKSRRSNNGGSSAGTGSGAARRGGAQEVEVLFVQYNRSGSGFLDKQEFANAVQRDGRGEALSGAELDEIFLYVDTVRPPARKTARPRGRRLHRDGWSCLRSWPRGLPSAR